MSARSSSSYATHQVVLSSRCSARVQWSSGFPDHRGPVLELRQIGQRVGLDERKPLGGGRRPASIWGQRGSRFFHFPRSPGPSAPLDRELLVEGQVIHRPVELERGECLVGRLRESTSLVCSSPSTGASGSAISSSGGTRSGSRESRGGGNAGGEIRFRCRGRRASSRRPEEAAPSPRIVTFGHGWRSGAPRDDPRSPRASMSPASLRSCSSAPPPRAKTPATARPAWPDVLAPEN